MTRSLVALIACFALSASAQAPAPSPTPSPAPSPAPSRSPTPSAAPPPPPPPAPPLSPPVPIPIAPAVTAPAPTPAPLTRPSDVTPEALFTQANTAFLSGDLARATAFYTALVDEGMTSPELETNLGTALLRQGRRGLAALHFERALFLSPGDEEARVGLIELHRGNVDRLEGEAEDGGGETLYRLLAPLPGNGAALALVVSWTLAWLLVLLRLSGLSLSRTLPMGALLLGTFLVSSVAGLVALGGGVGHRLALRRAVVVAPSSPAREGPSARSASAFEVHEGTLVRVDDAENGFRRIKLTNGLTGWVPSEAVELVVAPRWGGLTLR